MSKRIKCSLSQSSIQQAIREIEQYKQEMLTKCRTVAERLCDVGIQIATENAGGYGKYIKISHDYGYATAYGHLSSIEISAGDYVSKGQIIGYVGSTGYSTGPHLHFEVLLYGEQVNPRRLIK